MDNKNYGFRNISEIDYEFIYQLKKDAYKKYVEANWGTWNEHDQREYFENFINRIKNDAYIIQYFKQNPVGKLYERLGFKHIKRRNANCSPIL